MKKRISMLIIGLAYVLFAVGSAGAQVVLSSRRLESVQEVADDIVAAGGKAVAQACHAGHLEEIEALFDAYPEFIAPSTHK